MKLSHYLISALIILFAACSSGTNKSNDSQVDSMRKSGKPRIDTNVMIKDTFFINRTVDHQNQLIHAIYIDPNKDSHTHDWVFGLYSQDKTNLKKNLAQLTKGKHALTHVNIGNFPAEWRPVYSLKGKYYLYDSNDTSDKNTMLLTDSVLMTYLFGDGYDTIAIESFQRRSDAWVTIKTKQYPGIENSNPAEVNIYTIDKNTGLSVWVMGDDAELMIPRQGVGNYPVIVNRSVKSRYPELEFDNIDAKALIQK